MKKTRLNPKQAKARYEYVAKLLDEGKTPSQVANIIGIKKEAMGHLMKAAKPLMKNEVNYDRDINYDRSVYGDFQIMATPKQDARFGELLSMGGYF